MRRANGGDATAQHELGLRYLNGEGFGKDTAKSFFWISKAAAQFLPSACYNLGLFYHNAWQTEWNPFTAYRYFRMAGEWGLPEGAFVTGLAFTDNLVVQKNTDSAFYFIKLAADRKFPPAVEALARMRKDYLEASTDSLNKTIYRFDTTVTRVKTDITSLGFFNPVRDSLIVPNDSSFFISLLRTGGKELKQYLGFAGIDSIESLSAPAVAAILLRAAESGSPEANLFLGKFYENGVFVQKDLLKAAVYYIRAVRLEAPQASLFLTILTGQKQLLKQFERSAAARDSDALFVFAMLNVLGRQSTLSPQTLVQWLGEAADKNHVPALLELGQCYLLGNGVVCDTQKAKVCWEKAAALGSGEGKIRLMFSSLNMANRVPPSKENILMLEHENGLGSVSAQSLLGFLSENGLGVKKDIHAASLFYRAAAARGNTAGFTSLKRLYDRLRPAKPEFKLFAE